MAYQEREKPPEAWDGFSKNGGEPRNRQQHHANHGSSCQSLRDAMSEAGIEMPPDLTPDSKIHRFGKNQNQWAVLHRNPDGTEGSAFGDWSTGVSETWFSGGTADADFRQHLEIVRQFHDEEARERQAKAKARAAELWAKSRPVEDHPYLAKKGVKAPGLRAMGAALVVPAMDAEGNIQSLQFIQADGSKRFLKGAPTAGGSFTIHGTEPGTIAICEGLATGGSVHAATGWTVVCSFSAGNLKSVCEQVRGKFPNARIIIAGDHDESQAGERYGRAAAEAVGGRYVQPEAVGMDWNDVHKKKGLEGVKEGLEGAEALGVFEGDPSRYSLDVLGWLANEPDPIDYVVKDILPTACLGVLGGPSGVGKTTWSLTLAMSIATGRPILPGMDPGGEAGPVILVTCEDDARFLHRNVRRIAQNQFPFDWELLKSNLHIIPAAGADVRLLSGPNGQEAETAIAGQIRTMADNLRPRLIVLDPLSRFFSGEENNNSLGTRFMTILEKLAANTGAGVIICHHTHKRAGIVGGKFSLDDALSTDVLRGASAILGSVRAAIIIAPIPEKQAGRHIKDPEPGKSYLAYKAAKVSHGPQGPVHFLVRGLGGVLEPAVKAKTLDQDEDTILRDAIKAKVKEFDKKITVKALKETLHTELKKTGFKVTKTMVESMAETMVLEQEIFAVWEPNGSGRPTRYLSVFEVAREVAREVAETGKNPLPLQPHRMVEPSVEVASDFATSKPATSGTRMDREVATGRSLLLKEEGAHSGGHFSSDAAEGESTPLPEGWEEI